LVLPVAGQSFEVPFAHDGQLPVLRPPKFSVLDVETSDVSLRGAKVAVKAEMENPNVFALGLRDLGYSLMIGGASVGALQATTADTIEPGATGSLTLSGELTAADALMKLVRGGGLGPAKLAATGAVQTPFGAVDLLR
jgi:LEA14-like dessication related protein